MTSFSIEHFVPNWFEGDGIREKLRHRRSGVLSRFTLQKEATDRLRSVTDTFEQLSVLARDYDPDSAEHEELSTKIDGLAKELVTEIDPQTDRTNKAPATLTKTWQALSTWDTVRDAATADLAERLLNNLPGEGSANLKEAFVYARAAGLPFDEALDHVNAQMIAS